MDFFHRLVDDPFVFAQICLQHCLSDLYAMGANPHSVLAVVQVPYATPEKTGGYSVSLAGRHSEGTAADRRASGGWNTQLLPVSSGWASPVMEVAYPDRLLRPKGGMKPGDGLILTQPIGTGTLFCGGYAATG